jgi:hypothetical protein
VACLATIRFSGITLIILLGISKYKDDKGVYVCMYYVCMYACVCMYICVCVRVRVCMAYRMREGRCAPVGSAIQVGLEVRVVNIQLNCPNVQSSVGWNCVTGGYVCHLKCFGYGTSHSSTVQRLSFTGARKLFAYL